MGNPYTVQATSQAQTILRRRVRKEDDALPVMSTASLAPAGRVRLLGDAAEELVTYTGFGVDVVGQPTLTGCTRGANREQGGSGPRDWPGGTFVVQAPYEKPELVSAIPDATIDQAGRQVYLDEVEPELSFFGEDAGRRDLTTPEQWNASYLGQWGTEGTGDGEFEDGIRGITVRPDTGDVYVSSGTGASSKIQKFSANGTFDSVIATYGTGDGEVDTPWGLAASAQGHILIVDHGNDRVQWFASDSYSFDQSDVDFGLSTLSGPRGATIYVRLDGATAAIVTDSGNDRIAQAILAADFSGFVEFLAAPVNLATPTSVNHRGRVAVFAQDTANLIEAHPWEIGGNPFTFGQPGSGQGRLNTPDSVALDRVGNIYVTDSGNHRVQVFDSAGIFRGMWGRFGDGDGEFDTPTGIAVTDDYIYVCDSGNHRVQIFANPVAPEIGEVITVSKAANAGVSNSSTVTYATTVQIDTFTDFGSGASDLVLPRGTWTVTAEYSQTYFSTTVATWGAIGRFNGTLGASSTSGVANLNGARASFLALLTDEYESDGATAFSIRWEFVRNGTWTATPATEPGFLTVTFRKVA